MILASWNVRGVNEPHKQKEVSSLIRKHSISLLGLNETRTQSSKHLSIIHAICPSWRYFTNYSSNPSGRIWIMWDPSLLDVQILASSDQVIHIQAQDIQNQSTMMVSFIYGYNDYILHRELWASIRSFSYTIGTDPWLVLGDFNIVRFGDEKLGGDTSCPNYMEDLNLCCYDAGLEDLKSLGLS